MIFKPMNHQDVLKALEGHKNVIEDEMVKVHQYFEKLQCPYCGGSCRPTTNPAKLFESHSILPNFLAQCNDCDSQFSPYTRIEVQGPKRNPLEDDSEANQEGLLSGRTRIIR